MQQTVHSTLTFGRVPAAGLTAAGGGRTGPWQTLSGFLCATSCRTASGSAWSGRRTQSRHATSSCRRGQCCRRRRRPSRPPPRRHLWRTSSSRRTGHRSIDPASEIRSRRSHSRLRCPAGACLVKGPVEDVSCHLLPPPCCRLIAANCRPTAQLRGVVGSTVVVYPSGRVANVYPSHGCMGLWPSCDTISTVFQEGGMGGATGN